LVQGATELFGRVAVILAKMNRRTSSVSLALAAALVLFAIQGNSQAKRQGQSKTAQEILAGLPKAMQSITAVDLEAHAKTITADDYAGRLTATEGQLKAAKYFVEHFKKLGLEPLGDTAAGERTFYQHWPVVFEKLVAADTGLFAPKGNKVHKSGAWFLPRKIKKKTVFRGKLLFAGSSGIEDLDLAGTIPVVHWAPIGASGRRGVMGAISSGMRLIGKVASYAKKAKRAGAKACVLVTKSMPVAFVSATNMFTRYPGKPLLTRPGSGRNRMAGLVPRVPIPTLVLSGKDAAAVLGWIGLNEELAYTEEDDLAVGKRSTRRFRLLVKPTTEKGQAVNVCAVLRGRDPDLRSQAVIYSCHMDHLGLAPDGGVFNGADDNGSGCSTVLEIAQAYAMLKGDDRPRRSIIFLAVAGEELGLWGSAYYAKHPTWPAQQIIADVNMDMLGRSTERVPPDTVALTPTYRHTNYSTLARDAAFLGEGLGLKMGNGDRFYARSDHINFARKGIPVVFFCDDEHADYHMPTDTADKLEFGKIERIARLAFAVGLRAANAASRPKELGKRSGWFAR